MKNTTSQQDDIKNLKCQPLHDTNRNLLTIGSITLTLKRTVRIVGQTLDTNYSSKLPKLLILTQMAGVYAYFTNNRSFIHDP